MTVSSSGSWLTAGGGLLWDGCSGSCPQLSALPLFTTGMAGASWSSCLIALVYSPFCQEVCALDSSFSDTEEGSLKYFSSCFPRSWAAHAAEVRKWSGWIGSKVSFLLKISSVEAMPSYKAVIWKYFRLHFSGSGSSLVVQDKVGLPSSQASRTRFSKDSKI